MAQQTNTVKTFAIGFDHAAYDETRYAQEVARLFETEHEELYVDPQAISLLPRIVWHFGEPFADSSAIPSFAIAELTRRHVTVALNGDGGDENFGGYSRYLPVRRDRLLGLPHGVRVALAHAAAVIGPGATENGLRTRVARAGSASVLPAYARYSNAMSLFDGRAREALYTSDFRRLVDGARDGENAIEDAYLASDADDEISRLLDVDVNTYLPGDLLVKMDIASMAHSLEVRSPLLDHELMEMSAGLPGRWKVGGGATKKIFKDALRPWLPAEILDRPKAGFAVPLAAWFRSDLRELPREILLDPRALDRGYFREPELRRLIDSHLEGRADNSHKLWALIQFELWLSTFVDGGRSELQSLASPQSARNPAAATA